MTEPLTIVYLYQYFTFSPHPSPSPPLTPHTSHLCRAVYWSESLVCSTRLPWIWCTSLTRFAAPACAARSNTCPASLRPSPATPCGGYRGMSECEYEWMDKVSYRISFWGGGISGGKHVRWEYLTASMQNFKFGVDSRGETQVRGGGIPPSQGFV